MKLDTGRLKRNAAKIAPMDTVQHEQLMNRDCISGLPDKLRLLLRDHITASASFVPLLSDIV